MKKILFILTFLPEIYSAQINIDFEQGNYSHWNNAFYTLYNCTSPTPDSSTNAGFNFTAPNSTSDLHGLCNGVTDPSVVNATIQLPCPWGNSWSARLNDTNDGCSAAEMTYTFGVSSVNLDFAVSYAIVLDSGHASVDAPKFIYTLKNVNGGIIDSAYFDSNTILTDTSFHPADPANPGLYYCNWTKRCYNLLNYIGQNVFVRVQASDCNDGQHRGYKYLDFNLNTCSGSLNVKEAFASDFSVYPNPANGKFFVARNDLQKEDFRVTLLDMQGRIILCESVSAENKGGKSFDTKNLARGIYIFSVTTSRGVLQKKLIIE